MPKSTYEKLNQVKLRLSLPNKPASIAELADYMGCDARTIYRYLETLKAENCGLRQDKSSKKFSIQPVASRRPEAIIRGLKSVQKVLNEIGISAHSKSVKKAIDFLCGDDSAENALNQVINVDSDFIVDLGPFSEYSEHLEFRETEIEKFLAAIKERAKILLTYVPVRENGKEEQYEVCPLKLVLRIDTLYLVADLHSEIRLFALSRIRNFRRTGAFFPEIPFDYKKLYSHCFGKFTGSSYPKIKVLMEVKAFWLQTQFREAHFNPAVKIRKQQPFTVEMHIYDTPDFEGWLLSILPQVKILEPSSLKENLRKQLKESSKAL
ncbi:MAG: helix-turn-helix transcriptional regulator [Fibrobacter intestinalis]|uniref:helix-turn-helix transcriptional regulator n=1 Tax=Fibrobacter TaxID=832 RepID=UPI000BB0DB3D|nr:WYL domain-containing protein [Fibrobacter sp. UWS1]PBC69045.1 putative DNA-binding transcriptional regulator YafY [Fibrobacter sp. UWS1]